MMKENLNLQAGFGNLRVLSLESRRAREMAQLIESNRGQAIVAPATRDVPIEDHSDANKFIAALRSGELDVVIFLTGVGVRTLSQMAEAVCPREEFVSALSRTAVIARGPKPVAALRELSVPVAAVVPEPNTWRELLHLLDEKKESLPMNGRTVAVQEHGASSPELLEGLVERGANVVPVRTYEWSLPEDLAPLRAAVHAIVRGEIDILLITAAVQMRHLLQIGDEMKLRSEVIAALSHVVVGSIGPIASAALRELGIAVDLEPSHPKMGYLVKELAERSAELVQSKRTSH